jgi:RNA polymerase sigma-70 factor (ECF subfamily)
MEGKHPDDMLTEQAMPAARPFEREEDLALALASLDAGAWRQLFEENYPRVYSYAYLRTGNTADADDVAAKVFVEAVKGIGRFRYRAVPVAAWLSRIAHHETVDLLKRRHRAPATSLDHPDAAAAMVVRDAIGLSDERQDLSRAIGRLKQGHRDVLLLRLVEGRSVRETAAVLGKSEAVVKMTQMRALKALRGKLSR